MLVVVVVAEDAEVGEDATPGEEVGEDAAEDAEEGEEDEVVGVGEAPPRQASLPTSGLGTIPFVSTHSPSATTISMPTISHMQVPFAAMSISNSTRCSHLT